MNIRKIKNGFLIGIRNNYYRVTYEELIADLFVIISVLIILLVVY